MTFMRSALAMDPAARVSSREAVCHPLFEGLFEDYASRHPHLQQPGNDVGGGVGGSGGLQVGNANGSGGVMVGSGGGGGTRCVKSNNFLGNNEQLCFKPYVLHGTCWSIHHPELTPFRRQLHARRVASDVRMEIRIFSDGDSIFPRGSALPYVLSHTLLAHLLLTLQRNAIVEGRARRTGGGVSRWVGKHGTVSLLLPDHLSVPG